ncbi:MAG: hypothetical protein ACE5JF_13240 [Anaerolineales bacterium]
MIAWFASVNGAIVLSVIAMLSFIAYALLESRYFLEQWIPGRTAAALETLFVVFIVGLWTWGLFAASGGKRGGLIAALVFSGLTALIALFDLIRYSPIPYGWPLLQIGVWVMLVASVLAIASIVLNLRQ